MNIKSLLYKLFLRVRWKITVIYQRNSIVIKKDILRTIPEVPYLVLMPHADDELIGCLQLLKTVKGGVVVNMDMAGGDDEQLHKLRYQEFVNHMNSLNNNYLNIDSDKEASLIKILLEYKPLYIFVPSCVDWHKEHHEVIRLLVSALNKTISKEWEPIIAMYQVSIPIYCECINLAIPMNRNQLKSKWEDFERHYISQKHLLSYRFAANERINGKLLNMYAAECFCTLPADKWISAVNESGNFETYKYLISSINNISVVHEQVKQLYKSFVQRM